MPNYKGHLFGGLCAFLFIFIFFLYKQVTLFVGIELLICLLLGALFPDIDTKSQGQKLFYRLLFVVLLLLFIKQKFFEIAFFALLAFLPLLVKHRGLFHNIWFVSFISFIPYFYCSLWMPSYCPILLWNTVFFVIGIITHLWLDLGFRRMIRIR
jgi:membrane-bound metal-dependent hydrolase YbcI (DUF457 family)